MPNNRPLRVFLCHSSNDKPVVRELYQKLRAEPWIQPWLDEEELLPGQDWNLEIERAIEATDIIIVCLSKSSVTKEGYVQKEIKTALDYAAYKPEGTLFIIPVRLEECEPPRRLRMWHYSDYFKGKRKIAFQKLVISLKGRADLLGLAFKEPIAKKNKKLTTKELLRKPTIRSSKKEAQSLLNSQVTKASEIKSERKVLPKKGAIKTSKSIQVITTPNKIVITNGMEFMHVPAGRFIMGSDGHGHESPQYIREVPYDYWMARLPITNAIYNIYTNYKGILHPNYRWETEKDHPVFNVLWNDAMEYCQWLSNLHKSELPSGLILRLPTEAEWEKAARGTDGREYPWGNVFNKNKCNTSENGKRTSTSVGFYSPRGDSPYGCADMAGNVWEWTHSLKKPYPYDIKDGREDEKADGNHMLRGGCFNESSKYARCASRYSFFLHVNVSYRSGFRICLAPPISSIIS